MNRAPASSSLRQFFFLVGDISRFAGRFFKEGFKPPFEWREVMKQSVEIGYQSLSLVGITAFIMGLVLTIQLRPPLVEFGAESWMPAMVGISIVREIGPVIIALICAGRIASSMGAELGSMRVSEQIDAMEVSGTNPFKYLVVTRISATVLMLPLLIVFGDSCALFGSYIIEHYKGNVSFTLYFSQVFQALNYGDLIPSLIKPFFFGFAIGLVGCYKGFYCEKGTVGVGLAANTSVVIASILIFLLDFIAVIITDVFYEL